MGACFSVSRQHGTSKRLRLPALRPIRLSTLFRLRKRHMEDLEMAERVTDEYHKQFMLEAIKMVLLTFAAMERG
jgi:hypothetical protein